MFRLTEAMITQVMGGPIDWASANDAQRALLAAAAMRAVEARYGRKALLDCTLIAGNSPSDFWAAAHLLSKYRARGFTDADLVAEAAGEGFSGSPFEACAEGHRHDLVMPERNRFRGTYFEL